jgi:hypothetical protein
MDAGVPLARWSFSELRREVLARGLVATISGTTLWRWLEADAIRPWRHRSWLFPRDPLFAERAGPILDLYAGRWDGRPLGPHDYVLSADEKTSIQARARCHPSAPVAPGHVQRVEHEYERRGGGLTSPRGTCIAPDSSGSAPPAPGSPPSIVSSTS